jgi:hypothetical protein
MSAPSEHVRFLEALQPGRCPICFLVHQYGFDHLKSLLDESVTDPHTRDRLYASKGFCRRHAWQGVQQRQAIGMAAIYAGLLEKEFRGFNNFSRFWRGSRPKPCPICQSEISCERVYSQQFAYSWSRSEELRKTFVEKGILCLPHFKSVLSQKAPSVSRNELKNAVLLSLEKLGKDLNEFLSKQDYHRIHEKIGGEGNAWVTAVRMFCGERD